MRKGCIGLGWKGACKKKKKIELREKGGERKAKLERYEKENRRRNKKGCIGRGVNI